MPRFWSSSSSSNSVKSSPGGSKRNPLKSLFNRSSKSLNPPSPLPGSTFFPPVQPDPQDQSATTSHTGIIPQIVLTAGADKNAICDSPDIPHHEAVNRNLLTPDVADTDNSTNPSTMGSSSDSGNLWQKTLKITQEQLSKQGLPPLPPGISGSAPQSQSPAENIKFILEGLNTAHEGDKNQRWRYTWNGTEVIIVERWGKILKSVNKYTQIVDTAIQHNPEVTSLIWASMKVILRIALNHVEAVECFEAIMETIMNKTALCTFYASIYAEAPSNIPVDMENIHRILDSALPELYAAVIVFTVKATDYFQATWIKKTINMLKPFAVEFQPFIDSIAEKEKAVRECADVATMQRVTEILDKVECMKTLLDAIQREIEPLVKLDEILNTITETAMISKEILTHTRRFKDEQLLALLSPLEPLKRHSDIRSMRLQNTGSWLVEDSRFCGWRDGHGMDSARMLCCLGIPGAGKTMISCLVIDHLNSFVVSRSKTVVICLYSDYRDQGNQTLLHILGSFLHQSLTSDIINAPDIPTKVIEKLQDIKRRNAKLEIGDVLELLRLTLDQLQPYICIDALDELETQTCRKLLQALYTDLGIKNLRLFFTGRPHIKAEVEHCFGISQQWVVNVSAHPNDIQLFLSDKIRLDKQRYPDKMNNELESEIQTTVASQSQGMFLLPALHIEMVLKQPTISKRRKALKTLPRDLHEAFEAVITRIRSAEGHAELAMKVLLWLHLAYRPLKLPELQHALAVENGDAAFDMDNIPSEQTVLDCCLGLVIVDEETETVRFVHYSVEEYFQTHSTKVFPDGHRSVAETCLTYLNFPEIQQQCASKNELKAKLRQYALLEYGACNWGKYARGQSSDTITALVQQLLGIHAAAYFGLDVHVGWLLKVLAQVNWRDDLDRTPIIFAAGEGHEAVVRLLIEHGADVNAKAKYGTGVALSAAAENGHEAIVRLLIEHGAHVNAKHEYNNTALSVAITTGHEAIVRLLVEHGADVNAKTKYGGVALLAVASRNGHEAIVRLLIEHGANVNAKDGHDNTALSLAMTTGHDCEAIVRLLVEHGADVNVKDRFGDPPLLWAAGAGHEAIVRLLVDHGANVNAKYEDGNAVLSLAAANGNEAVVRLLIEHGANVNAEDMFGRGALSAAAEKGHEAIVRLLIEHGAIVDIFDRGALSAAAENGHEAIVRLLVEHGADVNAKAKYGGVALSAAANNGHEAIVRLLIEHGANVNAKHEYGNAALSAAVENGHEAIVRLLIEHGANANAKDKYDNAALSEAAKNGHEAIVRLLVEHGADVNAKDELCTTALHWAVGNGHEAIVRLLIEHGANVNAKDKYRSSAALSKAAKNGHEAIVRLLVEHGADVNAMDMFRQTARQHAVNCGYTSIIELLEAAEASQAETNTSDVTGAEFD